MSKQKTRNSNIEFIRLLAMFLIVFNHFPWAPQLSTSAGLNSFWAKLSLAEIFKIISQFGGLGDCLFFSISAWFLCDEKPHFKRSLGRIWQLEKQLLYYSMLLFALLLMKSWHVNDHLSTTALARLIIGTLLPMTGNHWWYPTAYALFLLLMPYLVLGLQKLGKNLHASLCLVSILIWGLLPPLNGFGQEMPWSIFLFIYQFILLSYLRWYKVSFLQSRKNATKLICFGSLTAIGSQMILILHAQIKNENWTGWNGWLNYPASLPTMCLALGLIMLITQKSYYHNAFINKLAGSTLAVYLVVIDGTSQTILGSVSSRIAERLQLQSGFPLLALYSCIAIITFTAILLFDFIRQFLFKHLFDRRHNYYFNLLWLNLSTNTTLKSLFQRLTSE